MSLVWSAACGSLKSGHDVEEVRDATPWLGGIWVGGLTQPFDDESGVRGAGPVPSYSIMCLNTVVVQGTDKARGTSGMRHVHHRSS
jgi:hypothetical protein